jgi:hypothetical protein
VSHGAGGDGAPGGDGHARAQGVTGESAPELAYGVTTETAGVAAPGAVVDDPEHELLTINIGPHHPATHGVRRGLG